MSLVSKIFRRYPALLYPEFRRYWTASFASVAASNLVVLGQGWLIFDLTRSPLQLGILGAASSVPGIVVNLIGGVIADRFDKRLILLWTHLTNTVLLAILAILDATGYVEVWHVLAIAALASLVTGIDWPVRAAIYPLLVKRPAYLSAVALNAFVWQSSRTTIPALGGAILFFGGTATVFAVATVGFFSMFLVMLTIRLDEDPRREGSPLSDLAEGVKFILREELFRWLLALTFLGMFLVQSYVLLMPYIVELLQGNEAIYGLLLAAGGLGSVVATLAIGGLKGNRITGRLMLFAAIVSAIALVALSLTVTSGVVTLVFVFAVVNAALAAVFAINALTTMQLAVPHHLRGRVMGFHTICYNLIPLGGLFLGALTEVLGIVYAIGIGCLIYIGFNLYVGMRCKSIREIGHVQIREMAV